VEYNGKYEIFDPARIRPYPLRRRRNKVKLQNLHAGADFADVNFHLPAPTVKLLTTLAENIVEARQQKKPVILFTGAHLIKNGLGPLLIELLERDLITLVAGNGATAIHDFELALIGQTSEDVPDALEKGQFGMAYEFAYLNTALKIAQQQHLAFGETLGRAICQPPFFKQILDRLPQPDTPVRFAHPEVSVLAACYRHHIPCTIHVGIGTDVIDQHPSFDGAAKGAASARDFLIYAQHVTQLNNGGVVLNLASAVTGPEVLLKAVSMAANVGAPPKNILTADFDMRVHQPSAMNDPAAPCYYFRDQKSVLTRIPQAFNGQGLYIQADQRFAFPTLYQKIIALL